MVSSARDVILTSYSGLRPKPLRPVLTVGDGALYAHGLILFRGLLGEGQVFRQLFVCRLLPLPDGFGSSVV